MTIAYYCVLISGLLPYIFIVFAKSGKGFDNSTPREYLNKVQGWRKRSHYAEINSFEAFPFFAVSVIIATITHKTQSTIDILAVMFIALRIIYGIFYILNKATLRSIIWFCSIACVVALYFI